MTCLKVDLQANTDKFSIYDLKLTLWESVGDHLHNLESSSSWNNRNQNVLMIRVACFWMTGSS